MGIGGVITALVVFTVYIIGVARLAWSTRYPLIEVLFVIATGILALFAVVSIGFNKRWGWSLALAAFSVGLLNAAFLFSQLGSSITMALLFGVTILAILISFVAVDLWEPNLKAERSASPPSVPMNHVTSSDASVSAMSSAKKRGRPAKKAIGRTRGRPKKK